MGSFLWAKNIPLASSGSKRKKKCLANKAIDQSLEGHSGVALSNANDLDAAIIQDEANIELALTITITGIKQSLDHPGRICIVVLDVVRIGIEVAVEIAVAVADTNFDFVLQRTGGSQQHLGARKVVELEADFSGVFAVSIDFHEALSPF